MDREYITKFRKIIYCNFEEKVIIYKGDGPNAHIKCKEE
jgi:hypothetical protein